MAPQRRKPGAPKLAIRQRCTGLILTGNGNGPQIRRRCRRRAALREGDHRNRILCPSCRALQPVSGTQPARSLPLQGTTTFIPSVGISVQCTVMVEDRAIRKPEGQGTSVGGTKRCGRRIILWTEDYDPRLVRCSVHRGQHFAPSGEDVDVNRPEEDENVDEGEQPEEDDSVFGPVWGLDYGREHFGGNGEDGGAGSGGAAMVA